MKYQFLHLIIAHQCFSSQIRTNSNEHSMFDRFQCGKCRKLRNALKFPFSVVIIFPYNEALSPTRWQYQSQVYVVCIITTKKICKEKNTLAFNWERCCNLVLCLWLIPFHWVFLLSQTGTGVMTDKKSSTIIIIIIKPKTNQFIHK
jgi:hypothetical protein